MPSETIDLSTMSPKARELLEAFAEGMGVTDKKRVIEDALFSVYELMNLVDTSRDPNIYPQDASHIMTTVKSNLEKFKRFADPSKKISKEK